MSGLIKVLVVDDSAFARKVLREVLSMSPLIEVIGTARDGLDALEKIAELKPDVITLDMVMPNLDGLGVLAALPRDLPPRVIVVSMADGESELGIAALEAGAIDLVHKPTALAVTRLYELGDELVQKVKAAMGARISKVPPKPVAAAARAPFAGLRKTSLVVIGASTGGPQALTQIVRALPVDFPAPVAIALHMPPGYTEAFAMRLDGDSAVDVIEAFDDVPLTAGKVVVARAGMHLKVESRGGEMFGRLSFLPMDKPHRPSVDVLFQSAAAAAGSGVLAVVLTGMGEDGLIGARAVREVNGQIVVESESSCVVYGMPRAVFAAGLADVEVPLGAMVGEICRRA